MARSKPPARTAPVPSGGGARQIEADLLAVGRERLERLCNGWRLRHLYPDGCDYSLLLLAYQELDRRRAVGRAGRSPRGNARMLTAILKQLVARDALARNRRLAWGLPVARAQPVAAPPAVLDDSLAALPVEMRERVRGHLGAQSPMYPSGDSTSSIATTVVADHRALTQFRETLLHALLSKPEAIVALHPQIVALIASAQPEVQRHPVASFLLLKLPLQLVMVVLTLINVAYIGAYYFFNDEVLGKFVSAKVSGLVEGELEMRSIHWNGRLIVDLLTGTPHPVVVEDVTIYEPYQSFGGERRPTVHVEHVEATLVLHEIIPWNRLAIPAMFEIPWVLHFGEVAISGESWFRVRGYRDQRDDGTEVALIGLRDAFLLRIPPSNRRGLSFAVDHAELGHTDIDVDFTATAGWRFQTELERARFALRFVSIDPNKPIPGALPLQFTLHGEHGSGALDIDEIAIPIEELDSLALRGGTGDTDYGDVRFVADATAAGSEVALSGRLRDALARKIDPALEPLTYGTPVSWGVAPTVELEATTSDIGELLAHVRDELELPPYSLEGSGARALARIEGPLSNPIYHVVAEGLLVDALDEPSWTIDDADVEVELSRMPPPERVARFYGGDRLVARFDRFEGAALDGNVRLADHHRATIVLAGEPGEPMVLDGVLELRGANPAQLVPDDPETGATLAGSADGIVRIDELRIGPVLAAANQSDGSPAEPQNGLQLARLGFEELELRRDRGPTEDGMPRRVRIDGAVTIDEESDIDWDELTVAIDGAHVQTHGELFGDPQALRDAFVDLTIDDGVAFARALDLPYYIENAHTHMLFSGPLSRPNGSGGKLRVTTTGGLSGPTDASMRLEGGVLTVVSDDAQLLGGRGRIELDVHLFEKGGLSKDPRIRAYVKLDGVDLGALSEGVVDGVANVELEVGDGDGKPARVSALRVGGTARAPLLRYGGTSYKDASLAFHWTAEELAIDRLVLPLHRRTSLARTGTSEIEVGRVVADGTVGLVGDPALDLHVSAEGLPLDVVAALLEVELPLRGQIGGGTQLDVGGTLSRPSVEGKVALVGLAAFGIPLGNGTLEVESEDAPAEGSLAAHRELWVKGELSTGDRTDGRIDWSVDAVAAIGKPAKRGASPTVEAQLDVTFDRLALPLLLRASSTELPGVEGQLEGLAAHVLSCDVGKPMLSDCATHGEAERSLAIAVSLDRAWLRGSARTTVAKAQRKAAGDPCKVAGTLCATGLQATLDGDALRLDRPLQLTSPEGTAAELAGAFDLSTPPKVAAKAMAAEACRAPPPPPPKVGAVAHAETQGSRATLRGTLALQAIRALLAPYGLEAGKGRVDIDFALDGPVAAPKLSGRLDLPRDQKSLAIDFAGVPFPIELTDLSLGVHDEWIAARATLRVLGEDFQLGSFGGARTGYAFGGACAGHFDVAAQGVASVRLLAQLLGDAVEGAEGAIDIPQAIVSGTLSPELEITRAEGSFGFVDHDLKLRVTDGLDPIELRKGRIVFARCGATHDCGDARVPEGAIAFYIGGHRTPSPEHKPRGAIEAEIGTRGRAAVWGRLFVAPDGTPVHTELDLSLDDVAYRNYDGRGRPVAEGELNSERIALRGTDPIVVQGAIGVARSRYVKDAIQGSDILALTDATEAPETPPPDLIRALQFDLRVDTEDPLRVDNNIASGVEANAQVTVTGDYDAPEFAGRIDFESGGRVDIPFLNGTYEIQHGRVNLLGAIDDAELDVSALRNEPVYIQGAPHQLQLFLSGTLDEISWRCSTGDTSGREETARTCFDYLVLGTGDVEISDADVRRFGGGGIGEARKPLGVVGHVTEFDIDERAAKAVPRLRGYIPDTDLRLGQIGPELRIATPSNWFDFDWARASLGWDYTRGYPGFFLRQSRQITFRLELLEPITLEFSRRIRSYLNQRVVFDPLKQRTIELRFDVSVPSAN